jgi:hypothetical protein
LDPGCRLLYLGAAASLTALGLVGLGALARAAALPLLGAGLGIGMLAAWLVPIELATRLPAAFPRRSGFGPLPQARFPAMAVAVLLALASALLGAAGFAWRGDIGAALAVALAVFLALGWLIHIDASTSRFLALAGHGPWRSVAMQLLPAALCWLLAAALAWPLSGPAGFAASFLVGAFMLAIATARIWLYRLHARRAADWILAIALVVPAFLALAAPPFAPILVVLMGADLYRRAARAAWAMP